MIKHMDEGPRALSAAGAVGPTRRKSAGRVTYGEGLGQHLEPYGCPCPLSPPHLRLPAPTPLLRDAAQPCPSSAQVACPPPGSPSGCSIHLASAHCSAPEPHWPRGSRRPAPKPSCLSLCAGHQCPSTRQWDGPSWCSRKGAQGRAGNHGGWDWAKSTMVLRALWVNPFLAQCLQFPICPRS